MMINLSNYEEYFLMYADKELSPAERAMVELFVQQNSSLKEEFTLISDTVVPVEEVTFNNKSLLFKNTNIQETDELLNLYLDNELDHFQSSQLRESLQKDHSLQKQLQWFERVKLHADTDIIFPDKTALYRPQKRMVPIIWITRIATAAIIIGLGWMMVSKYVVKPPSTMQSQVYASDKFQKVAVPPILPPNQMEEQIQNKIEQDQQPVSTNASVDKKDKRPSSLPINEGQQPESKTVLAVTKNKQPTNDLPKPDEEFRKNNPDITVNNNADNTSVIPQDAKVISTNPETVFEVKPVSYVERDENNDDGNRNIAALQFHKSKLGGFLKKASRVISRNLKGTRDDD